jgi:hypothetical protein
MDFFLQEGHTEFAPAPLVQHRLHGGGGVGRERGGGSGARRHLREEAVPAGRQALGAGVSICRPTYERATRD